MTTVGIVAEYNPFHLGHRKQFDLIRGHFGADTTILCIMSGNYVQRGEPAVFDKFTRAKAAVMCGADLVLELPLTRAISSAEGFAFGAVEILDKLRLVDALSFGSECGDTQALMQTAAHLLAPGFDAAIKAELTCGVSYPAARETVLRRMGGDGALLRRPNDILAVEYCKALLRLQSGIAPAALRRVGDYHAARADGANPSATAVRQLLQGGGAWRDFVPPAAASVFADAPQYHLQYGERAMLARLRALPDAAFQALPFGSEGLWSKLMKACRKEASVNAILDAAKSKRYARSRLMRMLMCGYLGISAEQLEKTPEFVRALAFDTRGAAVLRRVRKAGAIAVLNAGERCPDAAFAALERRGGDLYTLFAADARAMACETERKGRIFFHAEAEET